MIALQRSLAPDRLADLIAGNRILFHHGVVDAFGHLSVRHDADPAVFVMSRHLAPGLVTPDDLLAFDLDAKPLEPTEYRLYSERFIHAEIYRARPDVLSVVHCHAPALIPFGATKTPLLPIYHMSAFLGAGVPTFEIRAAAGMTDMLIRTAPLGSALAAQLGAGPMILMRGHGATTVGQSIKQAVYRAIYATENAQIQMEALRLGEVTYLSPEEAEAADRYSAEVIHRPWALWEREVAED